MPVDALDSVLPPELPLPLHSRAHLAQVLSLLALLGLSLLALLVQNSAGKPTFNPFEELSLLALLGLNLLSLLALPPELPLPLHLRAHLAQVLSLLALLVQQHKY